MATKTKQPKPDDETKDEKVCPNCGYCPHCGRARTYPYVPYVPYVPQPWQPWQPWPNTTIPYTSTITLSNYPTTCVAGKTEAITSSTVAMNAADMANVQFTGSSEA